VGGEEVMGGASLACARTHTCVALLASSGAVWNGSAAPRRTRARRPADETAMAGRLLFTAGLAAGNPFGAPVLPACLPAS
jgi:hypothetical protein